MKFQNLHSHSSHHLGHILQWKLGLRKEHRPTIAPEWSHTDDLVPMPVDLPLIQHPEAGSIQVTWIGHASFLVQVAGKAFLFDPVFGDHCSPVPLPGMRRLHPHGIRLDDLPELNGIFLSHNHYDHLEKRTIAKLGAEVPCHVPIGLGRFVGKLGVRNCREYQWWDSNSIGEDWTVHCVPAQHFSLRGFHDRDRTLWCGWVLEIEGAKIYFVGDTGYAPLFHEIRKRVGTMDLSMIPIGAYHPRSVMQSMHVDP
ncbi:MAG: N-acyl-phosphatidylethanolamine-hydrolyzing phospholipase D [Verrucomicrobiales bacterium]